MKGKQLAILLVLVAIVGGAGVILIQDSRSSWSESGKGAGAKVLEFPVNDVSQVAIKDSTSEVHLAIKGGVWAVEDRADYPADFTKVSDFVRKVWDLKTVQLQKVGPSQMPRLELVEPGKGAKAGTLVEFKDKDGKSMGRLLFGKKSVRKPDASPAGSPGFPTGRYVMPADDGDKVSLVSEPFSDLDAKPTPWLKHDFIKIEKPRSITLDGTTPAEHWKLLRDTDASAWSLADAKADESLDANKVTPLGATFQNPSFSDVLAPDAKPAETGLDHPATLTLVTFDGFTYTLKIGRLSDADYPVTVQVSANLAKERVAGKDEKPEDKKRLDEEFETQKKHLEEKLASEKALEGRPFLIAKATVEPYLKDRVALLAEKKPATAPGATGATPAPPVPPHGPNPPIPARHPGQPAPRVEVFTPPVQAPLPNGQPRPGNVPSVVPPLPATPPSSAVPPTTPPVPATPQPMVLPPATLPVPAVPQPPALPPTTLPVPAVPQPPALPPALPPTTLPVPAVPQPPALPPTTPPVPSVPQPPALPPTTPPVPTTPQPPVVPPTTPPMPTPPAPPAASPATPGVPPAAPAPVPPTAEPSVPPAQPVIPPPAIPPAPPVATPPVATPPVATPAIPLTPPIAAPSVPPTTPPPPAAPPVAPTPPPPAPSPSAPAEPAPAPAEKPAPPSPGNAQPEAAPAPAAPKPDAAPPAPPAGDAKPSPDAAK